MGLHAIHGQATVAGWAWPRRTGGHRSATFPGSGNIRGPRLVIWSVRIDIWSDVVCPFCFLGKRRLEAGLAEWPHADQVEIVWHSFELDPGAPRALPQSLAQHIAEKYRTNLSQAEAAQAGIAEQFAAVGSTFNWRKAKPGNTFDAHRVIHLAADKGVAQPVMKELMRGYFADGAEIGNPAVVGAIAVGAGLDATLVAEVLGSDAYADAVRADEAAARQIGITGVPFFVFDERLAVSGAQPAEVFTQALDQAWSTKAEVRLDPLDGGGEACGVDGCEPGDR